MLRCYLCNGTGKRTKFLIPISCDFCSGQGYVSARSSSRKAAASSAAAATNDSKVVLQLHDPLHPIYSADSHAYEEDPGRDTHPAEGARNLQ
ncbi:hypothetical protein [Paenibacillus sp. KR2-11]|uniref:hypothetical protein n=1 Tax=Paenibacillus sp. KR2-11 TaxID=3385500 RepID=UPI0038FC169E